MRVCVRLGLVPRKLTRSDSSRFTLLYTNRSTLDVMFLEDLADLKDRFPTRLTLHHIERILQAANCTPNDIVKCTVHLADIGEFGEYNAVYGRYFSGVMPARTTVQSVLAEGVRVEIDCIVKLP